MPPGLPVVRISSGIDVGVFILDEAAITQQVERFPGLYETSAPLRLGGWLSQTSKTAETQRRRVYAESSMVSFSR